MVIVPCSMKTLAGIAHGLSRNLIERAADVMLKERRTLVIVPRETPMSLPQLRNMVLCAEAGAMILPAMPAFYQMPKTLDDLADFMAGKILSALGFAHDLLSAHGRRVERRQDPGADRRDVRRDRAALRPPQSRAQRRPRCALAGPRDRGAADSGRRARARSLHRHRRSRRRGASRAARRRSVVGVDFAGEMLRLGARQDDVAPA